MSLEPLGWVEWEVHFYVVKEGRLYYIYGGQVDKGPRYTYKISFRFTKKSAIRKMNKLKRLADSVGLVARTDKG